MIDVKADMELFTYYGYKRLPFPSDYPWYWEALFALEQEEQKDTLQKENFKNSDHNQKNKKISKWKKK